MRMSASRRRAECGLSLLELLLVVALLGLLVGIGAQALGTRAGAGRNDEWALQRLLQEARERSLRGGLVIYVSCETLVRRLARPDVARERPGLECVAALPAPGHEAAVAFYPDGSSSGGFVRYKRSPGDRVLHIDWLTGAMSWG